MDVCTDVDSCWNNAKKMPISFLTGQIFTDTLSWQRVLILLTYFFRDIWQHIEETTKKMVRPCWCWCLSSQSLIRCMEKGNVRCPAWSSLYLIEKQSGLNCALLHVNFCERRELCCSFHLKMPYLSSQTCPSQNLPTLHLLAVTIWVKSETAMLLALVLEASEGIMNVFL